MEVHRDVVHVLSPCCIFCSPGVRKVLQLLYPSNSHCHPDFHPASVQVTVHVQLERAHNQVTFSWQDMLKLSVQGRRIMRLLVQKLVSIPVEQLSVLVQKILLALADFHRGSVVVVKGSTNRATSYGDDQDIPSQMISGALSQYGVEILENFLANRRALLVPPAKMPLIQTISC